MAEISNQTSLRWECVRPCEEDGALILNWRNDSVTRQMSYHSELQDWEEFYPKFLARSFATTDLPPLFAVWEGERVGFIFFESVNHPVNPRRRCCSVSINIAPEWRQKGLGTQILKGIQPWVKQQGYDTLLGEIKQDNIASLKAFENAGFILFSTTEKRFSDVKDPVPIYLVGVELTVNHLFPENVYIIAEAGSNWRLGTMQRDIAMGKALIEAAAEAGADAVKFQVYRPQTVYVSNAGTFDYLEKGGIKEDISDIFADLSMPYEMISVLAEHCAINGIDFLSTAFSERDFDEVDPYVALHKIASYEIGHIRLLEKAAKSGKPLILSTGAATEDEIAFAVNYFHQQGGTQLILLQCTAAYPAPPEHLNLAAIPWLKSRFRVQVGLSDHSQDALCAPIAATALGAVVIEKHFTLHNKLPGPDHYFAVNPQQLRALVEGVRTTYSMLGNPVKDIDPCESELRSSARRGLQALKDIQPGEIFKEGENVGILRPGRQSLGMPPRLILNYEGKKFTKAVAQGSGIQPGDLEHE